MIDIDAAIRPLCHSINGIFLMPVNTNPHMTIAMMYPQGSYPCEIYGSNPAAAGNIRYILSVDFDSI